MGSQPDRKLRIAMMLDSDGPGGAEMVIFRLTDELQRRGHTVIPVLPRNGVGWLTELFRTIGSSPERFWVNRPIDPPAVARLSTLLKRERIDVVHSHEFTMGVYGAAAARYLGLRHIVTMHGSSTMTRVLRRRIALRWAMRKSAHAVAVSGATQSQFSKDLGVPLRDFTVIRNGVPLATGNAEGVREEFGCADGDVVILAVGNLDTRKNHRAILEALARLQREGLTVPWRVIIAGGRGGDQHANLLEYVQEHGIADRVHIVTGRSDIADLQALADIFAMPSLWEGLPMALLEAMMAGNAIVASRTAGIPEAIADGREGLLFRPGDLDGLTKALHTLLTDSVRRRALGAAALDRAKREFTVQVMADRYVELYA